MDKCSKGNHVYVTWLFKNHFMQKYLVYKWPHKVEWCRYDVWVESERCTEAEMQFAAVEKEFIDNVYADKTWQNLRRF